MTATKSSPDSRGILSLDGGGAKGFYTLGVLSQLEAALSGAPLYDHFDLVFGTSTGAIIAALLALGNRVDAVHTLYREHLPTIMRERGRRGKTRAFSRWTGWRAARAELPCANER